MLGCATKQHKQPPPQKVSMTISLEGEITTYVNRPFPQPRWMSECASVLLSEDSRLPIDTQQH